MRNLALCLLAIVCLLPACETRRIEDLESRVAKLENDVTELKQKFEDGGAAASPLGDPEQRLEALKKLREMALSLAEKTYREDKSLAQGTGAVEVLVVERGDTEELRQNFIKALQGIGDQSVKSLSGVSVKLGEKDEGKTSGKGPLRITGLTPGDYELKLSAAGYEDRVYPFTVREGSVKQVVTFLLKPGEMRQARELFDKLLEERGEEAAPAEGQ